MALVPLLDRSQTDGDARATLDRGEQLFGAVLNNWKVLANSPQLLTAYLPFLQSVAGADALDQRIKELTAIQVAIDNRCLYTASHRCASAIKQGISTDDLEALAVGDLSPFSEPERLALRLARELTVRPTNATLVEAPQIASGDRLAAAQKTFPADALVELVFSVSVWNALSRFHRTMGLELDMPKPPAGVLAAIQRETPSPPSHWNSAGETT
jgi:AhpD family alkylhydroperoxidase